MEHTCCNRLQGLIGTPSQHPKLSICRTNCPTGALAPTRHPALPFSKALKTQWRSLAAECLTQRLLQGLSGDQAQLGQDP